MAVTDHEPTDDEVVRLLADWLPDRRWFPVKGTEAQLTAVGGLTLETLWLTPLAVVQLAVVGSTVGLTLTTEGTGHALILASAGIVTAVPLLLFAGAARRLPLSIVGFVQYLTPFLQFLVGAFVLHEEMPLERWIGFALVWASLALVSLDLLGRHARRPRPEPAAA